MACWRLVSMNRGSYRKAFLGLVLLVFIYTTFYSVASFWRTTVGPWNISSLKTKRLSLDNAVFDFSKADNITGFPFPIVPNVFHYIKFRTRELAFHELISMLSVLENHHPDQILIHCSECTNGTTIKGKYWDMLMARKPPVRVLYIKEPTHVYGKRLTSAYHASDVARIRILMKHGGIFVDGDVYVVKSLDRFRHFEMTLGWPQGEFLGTQVLIAHKNARFLPLWLYSYNWYNGSLWYYNAGELPTKSILHHQPELVHRVPILFGVHHLVRELYMEMWSEWRSYYTIHLLIRHRPYKRNTTDIETFDEVNIKTFRYTFGEMARCVLYNSADLIT